MKVKHVNQCRHKVWHPVEGLARFAIRGRVSNQSYTKLVVELIQEVLSPDLIRIVADQLEEDAREV